MAGLLTGAEAAAIRRDLALLLVHTYTRVPVTLGFEDAHYNATPFPGTAVFNVACRYQVADRVRIDEGGVTTVQRPTLRVSPDDPLKTGDRVESIRNAEGSVLATGPFEVGQRLDSDGLGVTLVKRFELRGGDPVGTV